MKRTTFVVMLRVTFALLALPLGVLAQEAPPDVTPVVGELTTGIEAFLTSAGPVFDADGLTVQGAALKVRQRHRRRGRCEDPAVITAPLRHRHRH
jgi:hypothetical protein